MQESLTKECLKGDYCVKLLMAIVVVAIHTTDWNLLGLTKVAVPYFFVSSGYFLFRKIDGKNRQESLNIVRDWICKILRLYLICTLVYLPFTIYGFYQDNLSLSKSIVLFLRNFCFVGENYLSWPLWYLLAVVWSGCIIYVMRSLNCKVWLMFAIALALYLMANILGLDNNDTYIKLFKTTRNGPFFGLLYITSGGCVYCYNLLKIKRQLLCIICFVSFVLMQFVHQFNYVFVLTLFMTAISIPMDYMAENYAVFAGSMSKWIYLLHMIFAGIILLLMNDIPDWVTFLAVASISIVVSYFIVRHQVSKMKTTI